jgi:hypothetical protein
VAMNALSRSWGLLKLSVRVIDQDKEMLLFPLLAGLSSLAFLVAMVYPTFLAAGVDDEFGAVEAVVVFVLYFGLAFIATFFNVCVVYTAKTRLEGGDATFGESLKFALGRSHRILAWSAVSASVGLVLRGLDTLAERAGGVAEALIRALSSLLGALWSVATIFVVPVLVYHDIGPFAAISKSVETLKQTWGESLVRHFGLGLIEFLFLLLGVGLGYALFAIAGGDATMFWIALGVTVSYFLAVILFFSLANAVFNTALYVYAETKRVPQGYDEELLVGAFLPRG